jgi:hypothetical protein
MPRVAGDHVDLSLTLLACCKQHGTRCTRGRKDLAVVSNYSGNEWTRIGNHIGAELDPATVAASAQWPVESLHVTRMRQSFQKPGIRADVMSSHSSLDESNSASASRTALQIIRQRRWLRRVSVGSLVVNSQTKIRGILRTGRRMRLRAQRLGGPCPPTSRRNPHSRIISGSAAARA